VFSRYAQFSCFHSWNLFISYDNHDKEEEISFYFVKVEISVTGKTLRVIVDKANEMIYPRSDNCFKPEQELGVKSHLLCPFYCLHQA
jgi:hypothetical protein